MVPYRIIPEEIMPTGYVPRSLARSSKTLVSLYTYVYESSYQVNDDRGQTCQDDLVLFPTLRTVYSEIAYFCILFIFCILICIPVCFASFSAGQTVFFQKTYFFGYGTGTVGSFIDLAVSLINCPTSFKKYSLGTFPPMILDILRYCTLKCSQNQFWEHFSLHPIPIRRLKCPLQSSFGNILIDNQKIKCSFRERYTISFNITVNMNIDNTTKTIENVILLRKQNAFCSTF